MSRRRFRVCTSAVFLLSILIRYLVPPSPNYGAVHDDELMVRMAANILRGRWLGDYQVVGHLTLSKPAGYPLFLAWSHWLPWAPTVTIHLLLLLGVLVTAMELRALGLGRSSVLGFVFLSALNPQWFGYQMSRIYRDGFLAALTFMGIGLGLLLGRLLKERINQRSRTASSRAVLLGVAFVTGLTLSWAIATKPSWYPLAFVITGLIFCRLLNREILQWRKWLSNAAVAAVSFLIGLFAIVGYVSQKNSSHYGVRQLDTFSYGSFPVALGEWTSVKSTAERRYVLVDVTQRQAVYKVSSLARQLEPFLEKTWGQGWRGSACSSPLKICDESATWFVWDLRDAMHDAGFDSNAVQFEEKFAQLESDIRDGCRSGQLKCGQGGIAPGVMPVERISKREVVDAVATALDWMVFPDIGSTVRGGPAAGDTSRIADWDLAVKGLPSRAEPNVYRPEVSSVGNTMLLLSRGFGVLWPIVILLSLYQILRSWRLDSPNRERTLVSVVALTGLLMFIGQLALLEASTGMYLSTGKQLYLLPEFPLLLLVLGLELSKLEKGT